MKSPLDKLPNFTQRIIAAAVGVSLIITAVIYDEWSFLLLFCTIGLLTQLEFYKLLGLDGNRPLTYYGTATGIFINIITFLIEKGDLPPKYYFLLGPIASMVFFIKLYKKKDLKPFQNIAFTFLGIIYVALPFAFLNVLSLHNGAYNFEIILGSLFLLWATDSGAYFGKRKLFERVSPKKSWEGAIGGAILALVVAYFLGIYFTTYQSWHWYCIAVIIAIAGTFGDLVESLFKRSMAIKDSGNTIPGHGGFLDRFDGLLLSIPFIVTFVKLFS
jgi:phosphatidate cytidylyltransferase